MVSFKKPNLNTFQERIHIATLFVTICFLLLVTRLAWLQLVSHSKYHLLAESNRIALVPAPANRGLIIDRNGVVIGRNYSALTLDVNAGEVKGNVDQLIDDLSNFLLKCLSKYLGWNVDLQLMHSQSNPGRLFWRHELLQEISLQTLF